MGPTKGTGCSKKLMGDYENDWIIKSRRLVGVFVYSKKQESITLLEQRFISNSVPIRFLYSQASLINSERSSFTRQRHGVYQLYEWIFDLLGLACNIYNSVTFFFFF